MFRYNCTIVNDQYAKFKTNCQRLAVIFMVLQSEVGARGGAVVESVLYKPEGRGFDSR
jgi:hypothetical protein